METSTKRRALGRGLEELFYNEPIDYNKVEEKILKEKKGVVELQKSIQMIAKKWLAEHILENDLQIEKWRKSLIVTEKDLHASL